MKGILFIFTNIGKLCVRARGCTHLTKEPPGKQKPNFHSSCEGRNSPWFGLHQRAGRNRACTRLSQPPKPGDYCLYHSGFNRSPLGNTAVTSQHTSSNSHNLLTYYILHKDSGELIQSQSSCVRSSSIYPLHPGGLIGIETKGRTPGKAALYKSDFAVCYESK